MMKKLFLLIVLLSYALFLIAQKEIIPKVSTVIHKLGDDEIRIKIFQYGKKKDIVFINLHSDETTSVTGVKRLLQTRGGLLIKLENNNKRNISFKLLGSVYIFDPNRIFSKKGIEHTLERFKNISDKAITEVEKFSNHILKLLPKETQCVIALHNNTEGNLSVSSYLPGSQYETDAKKVKVENSQDPDDFFLTTDSLLFDQLSAEKYNVVWQDNLLVQQDGSLSVYFGEKGICYLNCETEHGKVKQYEDMIGTALKYIDQREKSMNSVTR
jgi:hypothetical protein